MNCDRVRELLPLAAGGDLTGTETGHVELHLQKCGGCRQFHERLESNQTLLRSLRREVAAPATLAQMRSGLFQRLENPRAVLGWRIRLERFLMTGFRRPRYAVAGVAVTAIASFMLFAQMRRVAADPIATAAVFEGEDTLRRPDYRNWKVVDATTHMEQHGSGKTYIDPSAYQQFERTGLFPEGTVVVLESPSSGSLLASVKDSQRFKEGWGYFEFEPGVSGGMARTLAEKAEGRCLGCHKDRAALDQVFTQFYPVLRMAARVL